MNRPMKPVTWVGAARREVREFPEPARRSAGKELERVQREKDPGDWKPMENVGPGAREIRIRTSEGGTVQHRVVYVAKFPEAIYVLHAFEKKTGKTSPHNLQVAAARYRKMLQLRPGDPSRSGNDE